MVYLGVHYSTKTMLRKDKERKRETYDIRTETRSMDEMNRLGNLENAKREKVRYKIRPLGISKVWWEGGEEFVPADYRVICKRGQYKQTGVGL